MERKTHTIDATDRPLGRLACEITLLLRGKNKPDFAPYKDGGDFVIVENVEKMKITGRKFKQKLYRHHTGYPGGFRETTMEKLVEKKGFGWILKKAVFGMLPKNKLRAKMMKRLKIQ